MTSNRYIPLPLKREIRRDAAFGCVMCGSPIIEFHHIEPFHKVNEHTKENLVALCPEHHHRADCGEIPVSIVTKFKENPVNKKKNFVSKDFFLSNYNDMKTRVGSNIYIRTPKILVVDKCPLITLTPDEEGNALLNAKFYNPNNVLLAEINNNEWFAYKNPELWDISYSPGHLKINLGKGQIFLELKLKDGNIDLRADMYYHGLRVILLPDKTVFGNSNIISNSTISDCGGGIFITSNIQQ